MNGRHRARAAAMSRAMVRAKADLLQDWGRERAVKRADKVTCKRCLAGWAAFVRRGGD